MRRLRVVEEGDWPRDFEEAGQYQKRQATLALCWLIVSEEAPSISGPINPHSYVSMFETVPAAMSFFITVPSV